MHTGMCIQNVHTENVHTVNVHTVNVIGQLGMCHYECLRFSDLSLMNYWGTEGQRMLATGGSVSN